MVGGSPGGPSLALKRTRQPTKMTIMMTRQTKTQTVMALMKTMQTKVAMTMMKTLMTAQRNEESKPKPSVINS